MLYWFLVLIMYRVRRGFSLHFEAQPSLTSVSKFDRLLLPQVSNLTLRVFTFQRPVPSGRTQLRLQDQTMLRAKGGLIWNSIDWALSLWNSENRVNQRMAHLTGSPRPHESCGLGAPNVAHGKAVGEWVELSYDGFWQNFKPSSP